MKRRLTLAATLLPLLLAGCAMHRPHPPACQPCQLDPQNPQVTVIGKVVRVDQEVIRFAKGQVDVPITWRLPAKGPWRFPANGIQFDKSAEGEIVDCGVREGGYAYSCRNKHSRRGYYKYDIQVNEGEKPLPLLDPFLMND